MNESNLVMVMGGPTSESPTARETEATEETPSGIERRRHERLSLSAAVSVYEIESLGSVGKPFSAESVDLSRGGLGLRSRKMLHQGRMLAVVFPCRGSVRVCFGVVRQTRYWSDGHYHVGVEFAAQPTSASVKRWLDEIAG